MCVGGGELGVCVGGLSVCGGEGESFVYVCVCVVDPTLLLARALITAHLLSEGPPRGLGVAAEGHGLQLLGTKFLLHEVSPEPASCTHLGYLL